MPATHVGRGWQRSGSGVRQRLGRRVAQDQDGAWCGLDASEPGVAAMREVTKVDDLNAREPGFDQVDFTKRVSRAARTG